MTVYRQNIFTNNSPTTLLASLNVFFPGWNRDDESKKKRNKNTLSKPNAQARVTKCDKIRTCKWPFQRFPSAERASEFPCMRHMTRENTWKPDNAENTRTQPVRLSIPARFSQLAAAVRCETSRFFVVCKYCVYAFTRIYTSSATLWNAITTIDCLDCCRIRFFKKYSPALALNFARCARKILVLTWCRRDFSKLDR